MNVEYESVPKSLITFYRETYGAFPWALDFYRAMRERPMWAKLLVRLVMGKWAYREFIGLHDALVASGYTPHSQGVGPEVDYFRDPVPLDWWRDTLGNTFVPQGK